MAATLSMAGPAFASGETCEARWELLLGGAAECDNIAALTPGNDTRINLMLLLSPRAGLSGQSSAPVVKPVFSWLDFRYAHAAPVRADASGLPAGEGSRCRSDAPGAAAFDAAVAAASGLSQEERAALIAARAGFKSCGVAVGADEAIDQAASGARSAAAKEFVTYLRGAGAFYAGRFDEAGTSFKSLKGSADPWLADTADYMLARTQLNALQAGAFDAYGSFSGSDKIDKVEAKRTETIFETYLTDHPRGRYVGSARGLLRRVDWLAGWTDKLAARFSALLAQLDSARDIGALPLIDEIDAKLLPDLKPEATRDPMLLAVLDLKGMRKQTDKDVAKVGLADVEAQREAFASAPALHELLLASAAFYVDGATAPVLKGLPDATHRRDGDILWFSRQVLRGQALEASGDRNARGFWQELFSNATRPYDRSTVELALALHEEKHGQLGDVFAPGSLVSDPAMRIILLAEDAGPQLLRTQSRDASASRLEQQVALYTLLDKELLRGRYAEFLSDLRAVPADASPQGERSIDLETMSGHPPLAMFAQGQSAGEIGCPALAATVANLDQEPRSIRDRLCLGEFIRINPAVETPLLLQSSGGLGDGPAQTFSGETYARDATYKAIIADRDATSAERAYALYRAVKCFEPSGYNRCGKIEFAKSERKAWYNALKADYPSSRWAKDLRYWW